MGPFGTHPTTFPTGDPDDEGFGYPGVLWGTVRSLRVLPDKFVAMEFRAPTHPAWAGKIGGWFIGMVPDSSFYTISISRCPGQFADDPVYALPGVCTWSGEGDLLWDMGRDEGRCTLEPGKTYFLNAISAVLPDLATTTCTRPDYCATPIQHQYTTGWPPQDP